MVMAGVGQSNRDNATKLCRLGLGLVVVFQ